MSKLKMDEIVEDTVPKKEVPAAVLGLLESMGMIRCGNSKFALRVPGHDGAAGQVVTVTVEVTVTVVGGEAVQVGTTGGGGGVVGQPAMQASAWSVIWPQLIPPGEPA